jgi:hypothetical protein
MQKLIANMPVLVTVALVVLGTLGNGSICIVTPKVAKVNVITVTAVCKTAYKFAENFANERTIITAVKIFIRGRGVQV